MAVGVGRQYFDDEWGRLMARAAQRQAEQQGANPSIQTPPRSRSGTPMPTPTQDVTTWSNAAAQAGQQYYSDVTSGRYATPYADTPATDIGQRATQAGEVLKTTREAVTPRFGTDWDVQGAKQDVGKGNYGQAALKLASGTANAALDVIPELKGPLLAAKGAIAAAPLILPGRYTSDLSKTKHTIPIEEMSAKQEPTGTLAPRKIIQPADLQGSVLIGEQWDRTQAGHKLTEIGGKKLAFPVDLEGGPNYMRAEAAQGPDRSIIASDAKQVKRIANFAERESERTGMPAHLVTAMTGGRGGDFSTMMGDAVLAQIPGSKIKTKDLLAFDKRMREQYPEFAGVRNPEKLRAQFREPGAGNLRKAFAEESSMGEWTQKGFPDPGQTRLAITDPELLLKPSGSGYAIGRIDPGARPIDDPTIKHSTYPSQLGGEYVGGFERPVPFDVAHPDWAEATQAAGRGLSPQTLHRAFQTSNVSQVADQRWVDLMSRYLEQERRRGP